MTLFLFRRADVPHRTEFPFITGDIVLIDCDKVEGVVADNMYERSTLNYLIYNDPASYTEQILEGHPMEYLKTVTQYKPLDF